ncbi:hypothetical protein ACFLQW_02085 [Candidatus Zixiibacteriota bacterium]
MVQAERDESCSAIMIEMLQFHGIKQKSHAGRSQSFCYAQAAIF